MTQDQSFPASVNAAPVKSFFVSMLTRDIRLEEAILDLLDNCVDGILRSCTKSKSADPYNGFKAEIEFDQHTFSIADNCGGIPVDLAGYAFRMGRDPERPADPAGVVGVYGIGMKRAIFKMGASCEISTKSGADEYEISITPEWMRDEYTWDLPVLSEAQNMDEDGTTIVVGQLHEGIAARFEEDKEAFQSDLLRSIASHYALIIDKGFAIFVNGVQAQSHAKPLLHSPDSQTGEAAIMPYIMRATSNSGVDVFLAIGFTSRIPSQEDVLNDQEEKRYSSEEAGWTVICNDRVVLYSDKSELTGWGEAGIPRYHTQFTAISGVVEFRSDNPAELPTTTTKRGIDASSVLFLQVKNKMREGMKFFTDYTNRWKGRADETREQFGAAKPVTFSQLKALAATMPLKPTSKSVPGAEHFRPKLPAPSRPPPRHRRIAFSRPTDDVAAVGRYLRGDPNANASDIGAACFDLVLSDSDQ